MKKYLLSLPIILGIIVLFSVPTISAQSESNEIPSWIKIIAGAWYNDEIDDTTFSEAMSFLIENNIIQVDNPIYMALPNESVQIVNMQKIIDDLDADKNTLEKENLEFELRLEEYGSVETREWLMKETENMKLNITEYYEDKINTIIDDTDAENERDKEAYNKLRQEFEDYKTNN